ncbi:RNA polymerase sigma factor [Cryobacterium melibiosiphilum]|uniref:RNA polymerase sigma factor n=1 Tax=Cryobacterium melibiosiphilum TaxID=995039 RepID=A0A3A5MJ86_9MICO|nr:RNA polymerase sigma factor [Cryobacterium melibiosiphilum]RJT87098.1 RNA polymerase sigma factor [Cryobacterium melibiosiphilum]
MTLSDRSAPRQLDPPAVAPFALSDAPDGILAGRAADGDARAFEVLVRRHGPLMRAYATRMMGGTSESDDIVQESFITAWEQLPTLKDGNAARAWLMRITSRKAIDRIRARKHDEPLHDWDAEAPTSQSPAHRVEVASQRERLAEALAGLTPPQRQSWLLREVGGCSYEEIGEQLGIPLSTVRGLLARARRTLVTEMEDWR